MANGPSMNRNIANPLPPRSNELASASHVATTTTTESDQPAAGNAKASNVTQISPAI